MEYEKVFMPLLLVTAKRYAGNKYEFDPSKSKLNVNGLQLVKRDSAQLCVHTMQGFFDLVFKENDKKKAGVFVKDQITKLFMDELDLSNFKLTKKISKKLQDYKVVPPHLFAWQEMVDRVGASNSPSVGEMFDYVILKVDGKRRDGLKESIVDYEYAVEKNAGDQVDKEHYFNIAIKNPLLEPMRLILGATETNEVLNLENYRKVDIVRAKRGNLLSFFGKQRIKKIKK